MNIKCRNSVDNENSKWFVGLCRLEGYFFNDLLTSSHARSECLLFGYYSHRFSLALLPSNF